LLPDIIVQLPTIPHYPPIITSPLLAGTILLHNKTIIKMKTPKTYDHLFTYAITGVLLLIAAIGIALNNIASITSFQPVYVALTAILGAASLFLIGKAIKNDKYRLSQL